jgi:Ser/Thr protein kinase RdoA (MazF antagonist)
MDSMPSSYFPVRHSILDEAALIERVLSRYALGQPIRCRLFRRSMSDAYLVETPDETYFLKVYLRGRHSREAIEAEIAFVNDLADHQIPVAAPVRDRQGRCLNELNAPEGTRFAVLFDGVGGEEPRETNLQHSRRFGRLAARIHNCADRLNKRYDRWHLDEGYLIRDPIRYMEPYLRHRAADLNALCQFGDDLIAELRALLGKEAPEYGICHGDLHTGNARLDRNGELVLFDFDSFGYGWRALDIGVYRVSYDWMDLSREGKAVKARFWDAFLEGYNAERPLGKNELEAVALSLPIRHLELMGLTIRYGSPREGIHWISDEYFDRHMRWFRRWANEYRYY